MLKKKKWRKQNGPKKEKKSPAGSRTPDLLHAKSSPSLLRRSASYEYVYSPRHTYSFYSVWKREIIKFLQGFGLLIFSVSDAVFIWKSRFLYIIDKND